MKLTNLHCLVLGMSLLSVCTIALRPAQAAIWSVNASGTWTNDANWNPSHANGVDAVAELTTAITGDRVITLDAPITIGELNINYTFGANSNEYTIAGANVLTFEVSSGNATITRTAGRTDIISAPVVLNDSLVISQPDTSGSGNFTISGAISGNASVTRTGGNSGSDGIAGLRVILSSSGNSYSGDTIVSGGRLRAGNLSAIPSGAGKGNVQINSNGLDTSALELNLAGTYNINGLSGDGFVVHGASAGNNITLAVGNNDATSTFSGVMRLEVPTSTDRLLSLSKVGTRTMTLSGANTYPGTTSVSAGTLIVNGSHLTANANALGAYTVASGATLAGNGTIGAVVDLSGTISPGTSVGTLTIGGLTLQDLSSSVYELVNTPGAHGPGAGNDLLDIAGTLTGFDSTNVGIDVEAVGGGDLSAAGSWILAQYDALAGTGLPGFNVTGVDAGYNFSVDIVPDSLGDPAGPGSVQLTLTAVPEPNAVFLTTIGLVGTLFGIRRRHTSIARSRS